MSEHTIQFYIITRELKLFFQLVLKLWNKDNWDNDFNLCAIIQNWFECSLTLLYVLHINPYWKLNLWAVITCDLLELSIFYMPFCSSLDMTFMPWKYFWDLQVSSQTIPSWDLYSCIYRYYNSNQVVINTYVNLLLPKL